MIRSSLFALLVCAALGCGNSASVTAGGDASNDLATDLADAPAPKDRPALPDVAPDVDAQTAPDADALAPGLCASAADCVGSADGPVCDPESRRCVACTTAENRCATGSWCEPVSHRCLPGCQDDRACASAADGGVDDAGRLTALRCDTAARRCVECLDDTQCPAGALCVANACVPGCNAAHGCATGRACCAGACVDTQSSITSCGACDTRCAAPGATPACRNGVCAIGACLAPLADCNARADDGCEVDTQRSVAHCGACGNACAPRPNATASCAVGRCEYRCAEGFADCDMDPANGCEVDTRASTSHCGACGRACTPPNGVAACVAGVCAIARCNAGFGDCDANATNGCEADTRTSVSHCSACGAACPSRPNAVPGCADGRCAIVCVSGFQDCDGDAVNGCEVDVRVSATHCGACGRACRVAGGEGRCVAGACTVSTCAAGRADCDMDPANGCEADVAGNVASCGGCGVVCPARANATSACAAGVCGFACAAGFGDCDRDAANGCETDTRASVAHCGGCGMACAPRANATASCAAGSCAYACADGFADCDGSAANGCETDTRTSLANCGACGRGCAPTDATGVCVAGACRVASCAANRADCDGSAANGCEVDTRTAAANCGACGRRCAAGQSCYAGLCSVTCADARPVDFPVAGCTNIAPSGLASAQTSWVATTGPEQANDGNRCTGWNAGWYAERWWQVDLRSAQPVRGITVVPGMSPSPAAVTHLVEASDDGTTWRTVRTISQVMASSETYSFDFGTPVTTRFLRMRTTSSPSWVSWVDVAVFRCP
jgi:F5/8 type C domain